MRSAAAFPLARRRANGGTLLAVLLCACAHGPEHPSLDRVPLHLSAFSVSDAAIAERGTELQTALRSALGAQGFRLADGAAAPHELVLHGSLDYARPTAVSDSSLYLALALESDGVSVDELNRQIVAEGLPHPGAELDALARSLAAELATSPRLADFLRAK